MNLKLKIWRQKSENEKGRIVDYELSDLSPDMSFLEMLDVLNETLIKKGDDPVAFDHDCREGICGTCGVMINGMPHGGVQNTTACQLHMRHFKDGETIVIEPFRAKAFPVVKDLSVNRSALDRIIQAGGYVSVSVGSAPEANSIPISKVIAEKAFDAAACIGCGACVAACKNASAMLFTSAKVMQLSLLPQGKIEKSKRVRRMVATMDAEAFGACTNEAECSAVCPKGISFKAITNLNKEFILSHLSSEVD
jgi:succinate dehydrogenase / fumarate reductase iron-sulfur subunit